MTPDKLQQLGREVANALWDGEGVPFDGYLIYRESNRTIFRLFLTERAGKTITVCTVIPDDLPSLKPVLQALRFYAEGALS